MISALDPQTALVLIDLQEGIVRVPRAHDTHIVVHHCVRLMEAFHQASLPVIIVNVDPQGAFWTHSRKDFHTASSSQAPDFTQIIPELPCTKEDRFITKKTWNAFFETPLHTYLQERRITGIVLGGIATSIGVEGTARAASELGYNVSFAVDAMSDSTLAAHEHSLNVIFPRIGESGETTDILRALAQR